MVAVDGRPPERSALHRGQADERKDKLHRTRGMVGPMTKVAVVKCGHGEHPNEIQCDRYADGHPTPTSPDHTETPYMQKNKWDCAAKLKSLRKRTHFFGSVREVVGVDGVYDRG